MITLNYCYYSLCWVIDLHNLSFLCTFAWHIFAPKSAIMANCFLIISHIAKSVYDKLGYSKFLIITNIEDNLHVWSFHFEKNHMQLYYVWLRWLLCPVNAVCLIFSMSMTPNPLSVYRMHSVAKLRGEQKNCETWLKHLVHYKRVSFYCFIIHWDAKLSTL